MRKTTEKGFTVVELLTSFTLASVVMILLFNILIAVKSDYVEDKIETEYNAQQSLLSHALNKDATNCSLSAMTKTGNTFLLSFMKSDTCSGGSKTLKVEETKVTYNGKVYEFPEGVTIDVNGSSAKEGDISGIQYFFLKIPITMNIYSTGETRKLDITSFYTKKYVAPPKPRKTYKVIYTDGIDSVVYFPDQVTELKAGENTPTFKGNPTRAGYIFRGWSPSVNPVVSSGDADSDGNIIYTATWERVDELRQTEDWIVIDFDTNTWSINSSGQGSYSPKSGSLSASNPIIGWGYSKPQKWADYYYTYTYTSYPKTDPLISVEYGSATTNVAKVTTSVITDSTKIDDYGGTYRGTKVEFQGLKAGHVDIVVRSVYDITKVTSASGANITGVTTVSVQFTHIFHVEVRQSNATYSVNYTDGVPGEIVFPDQGYEGLKAGQATPAFVGTPTRSGYTFMGWSPAVSSTVQGDVTYTATWQRAGSTSTNYRIEWYDTAGNTLKSSETRSGTIGSVVSVTNGDKTISGYTFDSSNSKNILSATVKADGTTVLKLYFKTSATYRVEWYNLEGDSGIELLKSVTRSGTVGDTVSVTNSDKTLSGFIFDSSYSGNVTSRTLSSSGTVLKIYFKYGITADSPDVSCAVGSSCTSRLNITNNTGSPVSLRIQLPLNGLTFNSASDSGQYNSSTGIVSWANVTVPAYGSKSINVTTIKTSNNTRLNWQIDVNLN